jgi:protein involved in polysaccharide export with SLBB domain
LEKEYCYHATVILAVDRVSEKSRGRIYVYGSVKSQGPQEIPPDENYTVSKAIIRAGGFGDFANKRKVKITRKNGKEFNVDLKRVIEEGHTEEDLALVPDDQIYVPQRLINM